MKNWDLIVVNPIFIVLSLGTIIFMLVREKNSPKKYIYYLEVFFFWFSMSLIGKELTKELDFFRSSLGSITFIFLTIFSSSLIAIIMKPVATWVTGKIKNRRIWLIIGMLSALLASILLLVNKIEGNNLIIYIFCFILYGFSLTANTLHYLFFNEQYFYRVNPIGSTFLIAIIMSFSAFSQNYLFQINEVYINNDKWLVIMSISFIFMSLLLGIVKKEQKSSVGSFDISVRSELPGKDNLALIGLCLITFLISISFSFANSQVNKTFITILGIKSNLSNNQIMSSMRFFEISEFVLPSLFGYFVYRVALKKIGFKFLILTSFFLLAFVYIVFAFSHNLFINLIFNFFSAILYWQIIFSLFSLAVMWNYRVFNIPVTGYVASTILLGNYFVQITEEVLLQTRSHLYNGFESVKSILVNRYEIAQDIGYWFDEFNGVCTILFSISTITVFISWLIFFFLNKRMLVDYSNYKLALNNMKIVYKKLLTLNTKKVVSI